MEMTKKILVVGGAGYVGSSLVPKIRSRCVVLDDLLYSSDYFAEVSFRRANVSRPEELREALRNADTVIWLAAIVGDAACSVNPNQAIATNVEAVRYLAENFDGRIIFTSTCSVYGRGDRVVNEDCALNPLSLYAETKIQAEQLLLGKKAYILRLGTLHGFSPRMRFDLAVNRMSLDAVSKKRIEVFGGHQLRPLLSLKDLTGLIVRLVDEDRPFGIYNIADENLSIRDIAICVKEFVPEAELEFVQSPHEDQRSYQVDVSKAASMLDFRASFHTDDSVREITKVLREGRIRNPYAISYANLATLERFKEA